VSYVFVAGLTSGKATEIHLEHFAKVEFQLSWMISRLLFTQIQLFGYVHGETVLAQTLASSQYRFGGHVFCTHLEYFAGIMTRL
jgi:hypothetical protein